VSAPGAVVASAIGPRRRRRRLRLGRAEPLVWIAPAFAVVAFIFGYSMVELVRQSLEHHGHWVGLDNFRLTVTDPTFQTALEHNARLLLAVPVLVLIALLFGVVFGALAGWNLGAQYFAGYLVEKSLSVDNLFVFVIIMSTFAVPTVQQPRLLLIGILGALLLRAALIVLGAALLWFGWFGFNAGSALGAGALATSAFVVTNTATAMAALTWMTVSWWHKKQPSVIGAAAGAVAGLVAITPASGFVNVMGAIVIGFGAGVVCYLAIQLRERIHVDDALDVWAVHGIGGTWGALATGLFATVAINSTAANGLFYGNPKQVLIQLVAIGAAWGWSIAGTFVILKVVNLFVPLRVHEDEEILGLDLSQHGEPAYASINAN